MKQNITTYKTVLKFAKGLNIEADSDYSLFGSFDNSRKNLVCRLSIEDIKKLIKESYGKDQRANSYTKKYDACDHICPICKYSLCISNKGYVYPCEGWQSFILGNIRKKSLKDIWNSELVFHLRNLKYKDFPKCNFCLYKAFCNPCLIMNANENSRGDYMSPNSFVCEIAKIKYEQYQMTKKY